METSSFFLGRLSAPRAAESDTTALVDVLSSLYVGHLHLFKLLHTFAPFCYVQI